MTKLERAKEKLEAARTVAYWVYASGRGSYRQALKDLFKARDEYDFARDALNKGSASRPTRVVP